MKYKKIIGLFVLLMLSIAGFAQSTAFTKNGDGTWTLSAMPNYDVELAVEYEDATMPVTDAIAFTQNTDGTWKMNGTMPDYNLELVVEYEDASTPVVDAIAFTKNVDGTWKMNGTMPDYDMELVVEYEDAELNTFVLPDGTAYNKTSDEVVASATYKRTLEEKRVGKLQAWFVPFDYTITSADESKFTFYKINMIVNSPDPSVAVSNDIWVYLKPIGAGDVLHANMPYVYKPKVAVTDYKFTTENATLKAKNTEALLTMMTAEDTYTVYGTYDKIKATTSDQFYYVNVNGGLSLGTSVTVGANRWIVRKASKFGGSTAYGKATFIVEGEDDSVVTGITNLANEDAENTWYMLDGVKLNGKPSKKGVYIVNGKKTVIQ